MRPFIWILALALLPAAGSPAAATPTTAWDKEISSPARFKILSAFGGAAVLDKETGLVWERSPSASVFDWKFAVYHCTTLALGNRGGWRLPAIHELLSLVDPSVPIPGPTLPAGNPFTVQTILASGAPAVYWSATNSPFATDETFAFEMNFASGLSGVTTTSKTNTLFAWCVRGGAAVDPQN